MKKYLIPAVMAVILALTACSPGGGSSDGKQYGYFVYPGTDWGMTKDELFDAIGKTEEDLTVVAEMTDETNTAYVQEETFLGVPANIVYHFKRFSPADSWYLDSVQATYSGANADYEARYAAFLKITEDQGIPYEAGAVRRTRTEKDADGNETSKDVISDELLYAEGAARTLVTTTIQSEAKIADLPENIQDSAAAYYEVNAAPEGVTADSYSDMPLSSASFWYGVNYSDSGEAEVTVLTITMYGQVADIMQYAAQNK